MKLLQIWVSQSSSYAMILAFRKFIDSDDLRLLNNILHLKVFEF